MQTDPVQPTEQQLLFRLESFDTAMPIDPTVEDEAKRRFMTLLVDVDDGDHGNIGRVLRAHNTAGETFAVKVLADNRFIAPHGHEPRTADEAAIHLANTAALFEEYRSLCSVSHLYGFPRAYGYGTCQGEPLILMEWVEGSALTEVRDLLPRDAEGITPAAVASVGCAVLDALLGTRNLATPLVHRDLSPANIMFRTARRGIRQQIETLDFDPCLIDMGSAAAIAGSDTLTKRADIWRYATPAYAAPEMLTQDVPGIAQLRRSPAIDVYELSSILYELYSGLLPFDTSAQATKSSGSYYLLKTQNKPQPLEVRREGDGALVDAIMLGLSREQDARPSEYDLYQALSPYTPTYGERVVVAAQSAESPVDIDAGTHLKVDVAAERAQALLDAARAKSISRRKFIVVGAAALAVGVTAAGIATHGFGIPEYMNGIRGSLGDYTWDQLQKISLKIKGAADEAEAHKIAMHYHLLDEKGHIPYPCTKRVTLGNGINVGAQLVGIYHDDLSDGTGKAGLSFLFDAGIAERAATDTPTSHGWRACDLRTWLDRKGLDLLPEDLRICVVPVDKLSNNVGAATDVSCLTALSASLWLPSMTELAGEQPPKTFSKEFRWLSPIYSSEGTEYQLFRELEITPYSSNNKLVRQWKGKDTCWWERTVSPDKSAEEDTLCLNRVGANGDVYMFSTAAHDPDKRTCVIPGFCI